MGGDRSRSPNGRRNKASGPIAGGRRVLNTPGPTEVPEAVLNAMRIQPDSLGSAELDTLTESIMTDLRPLFGCSADSEIFLHSANGHGMWDALLVNTLKPEETVLALDTGMFGISWAHAAEACGLKSELLEGSWERDFDVSKLEKRLSADSDRKIRAILVVHVDTASGILCDIHSIAEAIRQSGHDALLFVDAVCSFGVHKLEMENWGVDGIITASQKGLMCPAGLGILCAGPRALTRHREVGRPGRSLSSRYWDWSSRLNEWHYFKFCGTLPQQLLLAVREALNSLKQEGLEHVFARQHHCAEAVRRAVAAWEAAPESAISFQLADGPCRSDAVTVVRIACHHDPAKIVRYCELHFDVTVGNCIGQLGGKGVRISTMGYVGLPQVLAVLGALEASFRACNVPHGPGGVSAAVTYFGDVAAASGLQAESIVSKQISVARAKC